MTAILRKARELASYIGILPEFRFVTRKTASYGHMGAVLSDTVLQAGVRYKSVVWPRVQYILATFPNGETTTGFWHVVDRVGAAEVLQWRHPEKPSRLQRLIYMLLERQIESVANLADWLRTPVSRDVLLSTHGVGPKTVDYLAGLAGLDMVAVDRHVIRFMRQAGLEHSSYDATRNIVSYAADLLGVRRRDLDHSIWLYESTKGT